MKNILLCVAGMSSAIITETLFFLTQVKKERVDEIRVITTAFGRDTRIVPELLEGPNAQFPKFCRDFGFEEGAISFNRNSIVTVQTADGIDLDDIRNESENRRAANRICEIVRAIKSEPNVRILASAAGGRKTMGIYLSNAMQLFGDRQDSLTHVLVNDPFEEVKSFFYPPPIPETLSYGKTGQEKTVSTADARIELAEIPFIRLKGLLAQWVAENSDSSNSFEDIVELAQTELDLLDEAQSLRLICKTKTAEVLNRRVRLSEREFFFFLMFALFRKNSPRGNGFKAVFEIGLSDLDLTSRTVTGESWEEVIATKNENAKGLNGVKGSSRESAFWTNRFLETLRGVNREVEGDQEGFQTTIVEIRSEINIRLKKSKVPNRFLLAKLGRRGSLKYGLHVPPEKIEIVR